QHCHVLAGGGVLPHLRVHRRGHDERCPGDERRGGEHVVGAADAQPREQIGGRGGDDEQVRLLAEADVRDLVDVLEHGGEDLVVAERLPGRGAHELEGGGGGDDADIGPFTDKTAHQVRGLVGGDASADADQDAG